VLAAIVLSGFAYLRYAPRSTPAGQPPLVWLSDDGLGVLRDHFNAASGGTRVLLILSPT